MNWNSWSEFFLMGGYAFYVWGSVIVTFALLAIEVLWVLNARGQALEWVKAQRSISE
jgi:heme exporter protein D